MFSLYVDADSVPIKHRNVIIRRILKERIPSYFVADRPLKDVIEAKREFSQIEMIVVDKGINSADSKIVEMASAPALAITHDIPLASLLIEKGISVIDDRGSEFDEDTIKERLSERNMMTEMRNMGLYISTQRRFDQKALERFSNAFDRKISELKKTTK